MPDDTTPNRRMLPPVTVDTITYDGTNAREVATFTRRRPYPSAKDLVLALANLDDGPDIVMTRGEIAARHANGTVTVHSPAEVEAWGVTVEEWMRTRAYPTYYESREDLMLALTGVLDRGWHRFVTTFPDGSTHTTAWEVVGE